MKVKISLFNFSLKVGKITKPLVLTYMLFFSCFYFHGQIKDEEYNVLDINYQPVIQLLSDLDGDGVKDLASIGQYCRRDGQRRTLVAWQKSEGDGNFRRLQKILEIDYHYSHDGLFSLATGDLENDRDNDLVFFLQEIIYVVHNDGNGNFQTVQTTRVDQNNYGLVLEDIDDDGFLDMLDESNFENVLLSYNDQTGKFGTRQQFFNNDKGSFEFNDINNDGFRDLIKSNNGYFYIKYGDAGKNFGPAVYFYPDNTNYHYSEDTTLGDFNGDGFNDIISMYQGKLVIYFNQTASTPDTPFEKTNFLIYDHELNNSGYHSIKAEDLDGDSDLDLILHKVSNFTILENTSIANVISFNKTTYVSKDVGNSSINVSTADLNNDGLIDLIFKNDVLIQKPNFNFEFVSFSNQTISSKHIIIDIDNNGFKDVLTLGEGYTKELELHYFLNQDGTNFSPRKVFRTSTTSDGTPLQSRIEDIGLYDTDEDGKQDIVLFGLGIFQLKNIDPISFIPSLELINADVSKSFFNDIFFKDFDGDGDTDIIGSFRLYEKNDVGGYQPPVLLDLDDFSRPHIIKDYDNNGSIDVLVSNLDKTDITNQFTTLKWLSYDQNQNRIRTYTVKKIYHNSLGLPKDIYLTDLVETDVDSDGKMDLLCSFEYSGGNSPRLLYLKGRFIDSSSLNPYEDAEIIIPRDYLAGDTEYEDFHYEDYDADGDLDIIYDVRFLRSVSSSGTKIFTNDNGIFTNDNYYILNKGCFVGEHTSAISDFNNDGKMEFLKAHGMDYSILEIKLSHIFPDTDGDGIIDNIDTASLDACLPIQTSDYTQYDVNNAIWSASDCDGDGVINSVEILNGTNPYSNEALTITEIDLLRQNKFIYPNPVSDGELTVSLNETSNKNTLLTLYTIDGRQLLSKKYDKDEQYLKFNVNNFPPGIYILKIKKGSEIYSQKVIIK